MGYDESSRASPVLALLAVVVLRGHIAHLAIWLAPRRRREARGRSPPAQRRLKPLGHQDVNTTMTYTTSETSGHAAFTVPATANSDRQSARRNGLIRQSRQTKPPARSGEYAGSWTLETEVGRSTHLQLGYCYPSRANRYRYPDPTR